MKFFVLGLVLVHPLDGFVVPLAGFVFVVELPVRHRQEEPVRRVASVVRSSIDLASESMAGCHWPARYRATPSEFQMPPSQRRKSTAFLASPTARVGLRNCLTGEVASRQASSL